MASSPGKGIPSSGVADDGPEGSDARQSPAEPAEREERYGPLTLARHVKRDGRSLILYTRKEPEGDG
jgi:hypothetical protein